MFENAIRAGQTSVYRQFRSQATASAKAPALEFEGKTVSYGDVLQRVNQLANALRTRGIGHGDRVAILSHNRPEYIEAELAAAALGAIVCCLNWRLVRAELSHCISLVAPSLVIAESAFLADLDTITDIPLVTIGEDYETMIAAAGPEEPDVELDPEDGLVILYTSGTTGLPKGAVVSHRAMIARAMLFTSELNLAIDDGFVAWAPLFHMASTDHALATLMRGGLVVIVDGYQPDALVRAVEQHKIGWFVLIPGMIEDFIAACSAATIKPRGIKVCGAMADLVPPQQLAEVTRLLGTPYSNSFGATETGLAPASRGQIAPGDVPNRLSKTQTAFCEIRLVDPDDRDVADGEPGEMALRGPTLFSGYWNADGANAEAFRGGWFHMGDMFRRNPDGTLDFVDRAKYLIKTGGENVYPAEIEKVLLADPGVSDAAVVRAADPRWGETPVAFVARLSDGVTEASLMDRCKASLARYKLPREIRFIPFEEFPRSTSGKIQRHMLEETLRTSQ